MVRVDEYPDGLRALWLDVAARWKQTLAEHRWLRVPPLPLVQVTLVITLLTVLMPATPRAATEDDWEIPNGHFFTQTGSRDAGLGFAITNDGGLAFWSEYQRLGGVAALGYPISHRFEWEGALAQATQRAVLHWQPAQRKASLGNLFDVAQARGKDPWLSVYRGVPMSGAWPEEAALTAKQVRVKRMALLDADPALKDHYQQTAGTEAVLGLPTSPVQDFGDFTAIRTQRSVLRHWKAGDPSRGIGPGETRTGNAGEDIRAAGLLPAEATAPQPAPVGAPPQRPITAAPLSLVRDPLREPLPFLSTATTHPLKLLAPDAERWAGERQGIAAVAVFDMQQRALYLRNENTALRSASIIKVPVMLWTLERARRAGRAPTADERKLMDAMVRFSDNAATSVLLSRGGGAITLQRYLDSLGLKATRIDGESWGFSTTTASDMATLMVRLHLKQILTPALCDLALGLMRNVTPEQRWGISAGLPPGAAVALKNGWYPEDDGSIWRVHSIGSVAADGKSYALAVLTAYPQTLGMDYGQLTIAGVAERVAKALLK